ncbi:glutaredoxin family protein [Halorussus aquaticus]|uniref:Glutaredoxin family protein n=1 Tax=Halorussus aquaticus TaxID=2953748 RepID=A0ABD5Q686_9EURY|nr:glutaredoxin family protein [Halorussus aquaticus]
MTFDPTDRGLDADEVPERVDEAIEENEVVLFMKGDARMPQCGYSKRALGLVRRYRDDVETVDALQNLDAFREALEAHSGWETIPQTFVDGEFVGGSDILVELEERGDLAETLNADGRKADTGTATGNDTSVDAPF